LFRSLLANDDARKWSRRTAAIKNPERQQEPNEDVRARFALAIVGFLGIAALPA
jgi:hypothetical protein